MRENWLTTVASGLANAEDEVGTGAAEDLRMGETHGMGGEWKLSSVESCMQ